MTKYNMSSHSAIAQDYIPANYERIKVVGDLCGLLNTDFSPNANIVLFRRRLKGNFDLLASIMAEEFKLKDEEIFIKYDEREKLSDFQKTVDDAGALKAIDIILDDMDFFHFAEARPHLRLLTGYVKDKTTHEFHVDGLEQDFDRYMTCYNDPVTQFICNSDVRRVSGHRVEYDPEAKIYGFRAGDIWKQRVRNKKKNVVMDMLVDVLNLKASRAFVHRAPRSDNPRLMLVGDYRRTK